MLGRRSGLGAQSYVPLSAQVPPTYSVCQWLLDPGSWPSKQTQTQPGTGDCVRPISRKWAGGSVGSHDWEPEGGLHRAGRDKDSTGVCRKLKWAFHDTHRHEGGVITSSMCLTFSDIWESRTLNRSIGENYLALLRDYSSGVPFCVESGWQLHLLQAVSLLAHGGTFTVC